MNKLKEISIYHNYIEKDKPMLVGEEENIGNLIKKFIEKNYKFIEMDFSGADLRNADLSNGHFIKCNFSKANFSNAIVKNAHFERCDLSYSNLYRANFYNTSLRDSALYNAELKNVDFMNTKFYGLGGNVYLTKDQVPIFLESLGFIIK